MRLDLTAKIVAVGLCLIIAGLAWGDGTTEYQTAVKLYRGLSIVAASDPNHRTYRPGFTMEACQALKTELGEAEKKTRDSGQATYSCRFDDRDIITFHPAPILTCPDRPAPDEQETRTCPTGTVGTWVQDRVWTLHPYPDCWIQGDWEPSVPPEGMCALADSDGDGVPDSADQCPTVHALTPNGCPATPPAQLASPENVRAEGTSTSTIRVTWDAVAGASAYSLERCIGATCTGFSQLICVPGPAGTHSHLPANLTVRYRVRASRDTACSTTSGNLGEYSAVVSGRTLSATPEPPEPTTGSASLQWTPPTRNTNGSTLNNLAGYRVAYGASATELVNTIDIPNAGVTSYAISNLEPGTYHFAVRAYTTGGTESANSNVVSKTVPN